MTYSINISTPTESTNWRLPDNLDYVLDLLRDNKNKEIYPKNIRDSILTAWSSVIFKETSASGSTSEYIGIDTGNPSDADLKRKILLGKRAYSGTYSYDSSHDIIDLNLIGNESDIFLWNTKIDNDDQIKTKISLLSGNTPTQTESPYIQSTVISGITQSLSFDMIGSAINISSDWGTTSISGIGFPTQTESSASASNNKVMKWDSSEKMYWDDIIFPTVSDLGTQSEQIEIYGSPVNINGWSIELSDDRRVPIEIGDIVMDETFNGVDLSELLRRMLYTYIPPSSSISLLSPYNSGYVEVGTYPTPTLKWTINKKSLSTNTTTLTNMIPGAYSPITSLEWSSVTSTSAGIVISPIAATSTIFTITVGDATGTSSNSTSITGIYPYFYGFSSLLTMTNIGLGGLSKLIEPVGNKTVDVTGIDNLYFIYPKDYGTLSYIYDPVNNDITSSFTWSSAFFSSPTGLWSYEEFYVYKMTGFAQVGPPSENYRFEF